MTWWRRLFRLAERETPPHIARPAEPAAKEEHVDTKASVASLLAGAAGEAEAMTDCGIGVDDTELLANFINAMDEVRAQYMGSIEDARKRALEQGTPEDELYDNGTACMHAMQASPAFTSPWFMWRLSRIVQHMASRELVEAARLVVAGHVAWDAACTGDTMTFGESRKTLATMETAIRQLAAVLPKEAE